MRLRPHELALAIVRGDFDDDEDPFPFFGSKDEALGFLQDLTEEDFGEDIEQWRAWFERCSPDELQLFYEEEHRKKILADRDGRLAAAEAWWGHVTKRRCPECGGLCPTYREHCWVCEAKVGRGAKQS